ncbi:MAG TPA: hypothetical protein VID77_06705 [Stellaceae bacterium]|jgi:hypothetical protein
MTIDVNDFSRTKQGDRVIRRRVSLWEAEAVKSKPLMEVYRYWESLRPTGLIPSRNQFDVLKLKPVMGTTTLVDVGDNRNPDEFHYRLYGTQIPLPMQLSHRNINALRESEPYFEMVKQDYLAAREIGVPLYHEIVALIDYVTHSYARLILPFASDNRNVDQLMVCSVHQNFPDLIQLLH